MQAPRLNEIVNRVTLLQANATGEVVPVEIYKKSRKKKKSSRGLRGPEMAAKRMADALEAAASTFAQRFRKSQRQRSDGWLTDMGGNLFRAMDSGRKKLGVMRIPGT
jgi:hypothetical protein